jgi:hypothetical protein
VTPDNLFLISGSLDQTIILWQWNTMSLIQLNTFTVAGQVLSGVILASSFTGFDFRIIVFSLFQLNNFLIKARLFLTKFSIYFLKILKILKLILVSKFFND